MNPDTDLDSANLFDPLCTRLVLDNINLAVPWFLMGAYTYEVLSIDFISDALFDNLCRMMTKRWKEITHRHKGYVHDGNFKPGERIHTALGLGYPNRAMWAAAKLLEARERHLRSVWGRKRKRK